MEYDSVRLCSSISEVEVGKHQMVEHDNVVWRRSTMSDSGVGHWVRL